VAFSSLDQSAGFAVCAEWVRDVQRENPTGFVTDAEANSGFKLPPLAKMDGMGSENRMPSAAGSQFFY